MNDRKAVLSVRIDEELLHRLDRLVERTGLGRAEIVERCLTVGVLDEEEFVAWLETPLIGPLLRALLHPAILKLRTTLTGETIDGVQQRLRANLSKKRAERSHGNAARKGV